MKAKTMEDKVNRWIEELETNCFSKRLSKKEKITEDPHESCPSCTKKLYKPEDYPLVHILEVNGMKLPNISYPATFKKRLLFDRAPKELIEFFQQNIQDHNEYKKRSFIRKLFSSPKSLRQGVWINKGNVTYVANFMGRKKTSIENADYFIFTQVNDIKYDLLSQIEPYIKRLKALAGQAVPPEQIKEISLGNIENCPDGYKIGFAESMTEFKMQSRDEEYFKQIESVCNVLNTEDWRIARDHLLKMEMQTLPKGYSKRIVFLYGVHDTVGGFDDGPYRIGDDIKVPFLELILKGQLVSDL